MFMVVAVASRHSELSRIPPLLHFPYQLEDLDSPVSYFNVHCSIFKSGHFFTKEKLYHLFAKLLGK